MQLLPSYTKTNLLGLLLACANSTSICPVMCSLLIPSSPRFSQRIGFGAVFHFMSNLHVFRRIWSQGKWRAPRLHWLEHGTLPCNDLMPPVLMANELHISEKHTWKRCLYYVHSRLKQNNLGYKVTVQYMHSTMEHYETMFAFRTSCETHHLGHVAQHMSLRSWPLNYQMLPFDTYDCEHAMVSFSTRLN